MDQREVYSEPYKELSFQSEKYAANCIQLHLAGRNITKLRDFGGFVSLDTLWLNNNRLSSLEGLEGNFRLKYLFLHNNVFRSINDGILENFAFLIQLSLNDNYLDDLSGTIASLKNLHYLKVLDLFNNPIAQEDNYRLRVISELPPLEVLDRHLITPDERKASLKFKKKMEKLDKFTIKSTIKKPLRSPEEEAQRNTQLRNIRELLANKVEHYRIPLEQEFIVYDKRELGFVEESVFVNLLQQFNIWDILSSSEQELLLSEYRLSYFLVPAISQTGTLSKRNVISYRKLVQDILPRGLRVRDDPYRFEPVPEVSLLTQDLNRWTKSVERRKLRESEELKKSTMLASRNQSLGSSFRFIPPIEPPSTATILSNGLTAWEIAEALHKFDEISGKKQVKDDKFSREEVHRILLEIQRLGKVPTEGIESALVWLVGNQDSIPLESLKKKLGFPVKASKTTTNTTSNMAVTTNSSNSSGTRNASTLIFRPMNESNLLDVQSQHFEVANRSFQTMIRNSNGEASEIKSLLSQTIENSLHGTRLQSKRIHTAPTVVPSTPHELIALAPLRCDSIIIPNMLAKKKNEQQSELDSKSRLDEKSWSFHLKKLGMNEETIELALERKRRSLAKSLSKLNEMNSQSHDSEGLNASLNKNMKLGSTNLKEVGNSTLRKSAIPPRQKIEKGWAASTGTIVFN